MSKKKTTKLRPDERIGERFEPIPVTPRSMVAMLDCDDTQINGLILDGRSYRPTERFYKTMAAELGIPFGVFGFFSPLEVMTRAAVKEPDHPLRMTIDTGDGKVLGVTPNQGLPMPVKFIENVLHDDGRLKEMEYSDGVMSATLDLDEAWEVPNDSEYHVRFRCRVPVDGVGMPDINLASWRQVCENGAIAEAPLFRTKMEIKDNSGEHFRRLLGSFSNPTGVEVLQEKMCVAAETKASVGEVVLLDGMIRRSVASPRNQTLLRERLYEIAEDPCVRYGVTELSNIGQKKRALLPVGCSVGDLLNFASELVTHHADKLKQPAPVQTFAGTLLSKGFDLEDLYPNARRTADFYLRGIDFDREVA